MDPIKCEYTCTHTKNWITNRGGARRYLVVVTIVVALVGGGATNLVLPLNQAIKYMTQSSWMISSFNKSLINVQNAYSMIITISPPGVNPNDLIVCDILAN